MATFFTMGPAFTEVEMKNWQGMKGEEQLASEY